MNFNIPNDVQFIIDTFYKSGYEAFMVGGCIRDLLLNKNPMDYDIATSAPPEITERLFSKTIPTGIKHGTITVIINNTPYEVTTYRTEGKYIGNRRPEEVNFVTDIKEDLSRRDFTINALAYNDRKGLLDFFNGLSDLNNRFIRCVGEPNLRFNEDALRMLRAIRFSAQLDFDIDIYTYSSIKKNYKLINNISKERVRDEFKKILLCNNPIRGLDCLNETNISSLIFSDFDNIIKVNPNISLLPKDVCIRISGLLANHDPNKVKLFLQTLRFSNDEIHKVFNFISNYRHLNNDLSKLEIKKVISLVGRENINLLINLYETINNISLNNFKEKSNFILFNNEALYIKDLNINGFILKENIKIKSGKLIGEVLTHLLSMVMNETIDNSTTSLLKEAQKYILKNEVD